MNAPVNAAQQKIHPDTSIAVQSKWITSSLQASDFMTLLLAALKNQDPLDPRDPREMMTQLAQLQAVAELQEIKNVLSNKSGPPEQLISLLGRTVWWQDQVGNVNCDKVRRVVHTPEGWRLMAGEQFLDISAVLGIAE